MRRLTNVAGAAAVAVGALVAFPAVARADDADLAKKVDSLQRRLDELEGRAPSQDEIDSAVSRYLGNSPQVSLVGGADEGKAGFPMGKKPFIQQGPNKVNFIFRNQVRYSFFNYDSDAVGTRGGPGGSFIVTDEPRDRSGFELTRLYLGLEGTIFCEDISYQLVLNFANRFGSGVEKEFAWMDWRYAGDHHVRAGADKNVFCYEEALNSSGSLAFVDRSLFTKAFALDSDVGVFAWGTFGSCNCPKQFFYKVGATNGEGRLDQQAVFNTDARDTFSDQLLYTGLFEWRITCDDFPFDEVDHRACEDRCKLQAAIGLEGYYENDDDSSHNQVGLALRGGSGPNDRYAFGAYARARWEGWTAMVEWAERTINYTAGSTSPDQTDSGAHAYVHYRFADSNWGLGARASMIWLDKDYRTAAVGGGAPVPAPVAIDDTIEEYGFVVNYFFWDHQNKISADVNWVKHNSGVNSTSAGYMSNSAAKGVIVEDGIMVRVQWQLQF